ncbi:uncharacterized protein LOC121260171 [Juglans microcarpa x Juglans regia]|uniref:uncharacterized protein LOC121260171 n=1 Tax=Juglans microcarpa x Juglans regia TaxID=2249226 RepID=UPI001B7F0B44|nr:uncharacterized protein LOC121260171 [Juglans microcarpa x Juglans regia]
MDLGRERIEVVTSDQQALMANLMVQPTLLDRIKAAQKDDMGLVRLEGEVEKGDKPKFNVSKDGVLRFRGFQSLSKFVEQCLTCQQVKAEHQRPTTMDVGAYLYGFCDKPTADTEWAECKDDSDHLTKTARFVLIKVSYKMEKLVELYVQEIMRLRYPSYQIEILI